MTNTSSEHLPELSLERPQQGRHLEGHRQAVQQPVPLLTFETHEALRDYALQLNDAGKTANVSIMDANGVAVLACLAGCYADEFYYYSPNEDGYMHPEGCCECESERSGWKPRFPVSALAVSSRFPA